MPPPSGTIINNPFPLTPTNVTPQNQEAPYLVYNIKTRFVNNPGITAMPAGGPSTTPGSRRPAEIVQLHQPIGYKIVTFVAVRRILQPEVPSPEPTDPDNETLIWSDVTVDSPPLSANFFDHVWGVSGIYVYALTKPAFPTDPPGIPMGKVAYDQTAAPLNYLPYGNFRTDLLSPPPSPS